jgi:tetraprenyl-beta-curcumene synthase
MPRVDPAPLTVRQLRALTTSAGRELGWGLRAVKAELATWTARAHTIPDATVRADVLQGMREGRSLVDGAALFWTLPSRRRPELLRMLVAFQTLLNFIDIALERDARGSEGCPRNWTWLARDALDVDGPPPDRAIGDAVGDDGGYLCALVLACRHGCATLAHYGKARGLLLREAGRARGFEIEHDRDPVRRMAKMKALAAAEFRATTEITCWELTGGTSSLLTAMAVLGTAADEESTDDDLQRAADAYVWVASAAALLDSYVDQVDDAVNHAHNWFDYYPGPEEAALRACELVERALRETAALRNGERHVVIVTSMTALALSSDTARSLRASTSRLADHGGTMTKLLVPVLRAWRIAYDQRSD